MKHYLELLLEYGLSKGLIYEEDRTFVFNRLLEIMGADAAESREEPAGEETLPLHLILEKLCGEAVSNGIIDGSPLSKDLFDTKLMGTMAPFPHELRRRFAELYKQSPEAATDMFYRLCIDLNYIRADRIAKDKKWRADSPYGLLDISINLAKPEKDPRAIAAAGKARQTGYPKCQLCPENEGYAGRLDHPARQNHSLVPVDIEGEEWFFQYSPYVYYNEHCIVLSKEHRPMKIDRACFRKLLSFVRQFPHYFIGSNADLPIVGGSILSHEHFQGGRYEFAMERAGIERALSFRGFEDVEAGIVHWPLSVLRLRSADEERLAELSALILEKWRGYSDEEAGILAFTGDEPHNTVTPVARMRDGSFEMDLVLRNNRCTAERPYGLFHPHEDLHHIKKENIGLIEVMGLAILPSRLDAELSRLAEAIVEGKEINGDEQLAKHAPWVAELQKSYTFSPENVEAILQKEVGRVFCRVLECAGVFKCDEAGRAAFVRFADFVNN